MRILSVIAQKPYSTGSGVYTTELMRALCAMGHEQAAVFGAYEGDQDALPEGATAFPVQFSSAALPFPMPGMSDEMPYESTVYARMSEDMRLCFCGAFVSRVREAIAVFRPDVILCHHLYLLAAALREAFPEARIIGICHGTDIRQMLKNPLWREYISPRIRRLDHVFCLHDAQRLEVCELYGLPAARVSVAGNGYNSAIFRPLPRPERRGFRLAFAGKVCEKKGVFSLLRALSLLPYGKDELRLSLAGGYDNADREAVERLIAACPYTVERLGNLPQPRLAELFNEADAFVLPSLYDGLPLVLAEAMACGARAICTDLPGIRPWMDENVPRHGIRFLPRPAMLDADTPAPDALPQFEREIAAAIISALADKSPFAPDLRRVSWAGVAEAILLRA